MERPTTLAAPECEVKHFCRAKYYTTAEGELKLAQVQRCGRAAFRLPGFEEIRPDELNAVFDAAAEDAPDEEGAPETPDSGNRARNLRAAKINAFDKILCNADLDTFATFTLSPEAVADRADWGTVYQALRNWLSDRVKRRDLKYVICPERHKSGDIHFHAIMNSAALRLSPALSPYTGLPLTNNGDPLYNITDWKYGFTSAERIQSATVDREKVAKYIFKYMGKQGGDGMIGGRYALIGGKLKSPVYRYANDPTAFLAGQNPTYQRAYDNELFTYEEWNFI